MSDMATIDQYETSRSRRSRMTRQGWHGQRAFDLPHDLAEALVPARGTLFPGESGPTAAVLVDWDLNLDSPRQGRSDLVLMYRQPTFEEWLELNAPRGVLMSRYATTMRRIKIHKGVQLEGQDEGDPTGRIYLKIVEGSNTVAGARGVLRVHAVVNSRSVWLDQFIDRVGKYNSTTMRHFGGAGRKTWLLMSGLTFSPRMALGAAGQKLYTAEYDFMINDSGWNAPVYSRAFRLESIELDADRHVSALVPTDSVTKAVLIGKANFSPIDSLLANSW